MNNRQKGAATLFVTISILALLVLITLYATKIGMLELKTSSNSVRAKEALHAAQAGIDHGVGSYVENSDFTGTTRNVTSSSDASFTSTVTALPSSKLLRFQSTGLTADSTGTVAVTEDYGFIPILNFGDLPPLMSAGAFNPNGTIEIITNSNGGGPGVPLSGWVEEAATLPSSGGSFRTCELDEYLFQGGNYSDTKLPVTDLDGTDVVGTDGQPVMYTCANCKCDGTVTNLCDGDKLDGGECKDFVYDNDTSDYVVSNTFKTLTGFEQSLWETVRNDIAMIVDCDDLGSDTGNPFFVETAGKEDYYGSPPIVWVEGDCDLGSRNVGSFGAPIILIVRGDASMSANGVFWGVLFVFDERINMPDEPLTLTSLPACPNADCPYQIKLNGGANIYGSVLTNSNVDLGNGSYTLYYAPVVLDKLSGGGKGFLLPARKMGSWRDF